MSNATTHRDAPQPKEADAPSKAASSPVEQNMHKDAYTAGKDETTKTKDDTSKTTDSTQKSGVMSDTERQARSFIGQTLLCTPNDTGLDSQVIGQNGSEFKYRSEERPDRLDKATQSKVDGVDRVSKEYKGRSDGLLSDSATSTPGSRSLERRFEPGKGPDGLIYDRMEKFQNLENYKAEYDSSKNPERMSSHSESRTCSMNRESTTYEGRPDGLKSFSRTSEGNSEKSLSEYEDGKGKDGILREQRWKNGSDQGFDRTYDPAKNPDGLTNERYSKHGNKEESTRNFKGRQDGIASEKTESDGQNFEKKTFDAEGRLRSTTGKDEMGNYVTKDVADAKVGTISQKTYENGTVVSTYPEGKTGPHEASQITQQPGRAPVFTDAQHGRTFTAGDEKAIPVATTFGTDGTVTQKLSNGQDASANLPDYVKGTDARELGKYTNQLEQATVDPNATTANAGVDGLFRAAQSRVPEDSARAKETLGRVAQHDDGSGAKVREQAANQLDSTNPRQRNLGADLLASSVKQWNGQDISNMSKHPSVELASKLGNVPAADLSPHKAELLEGLKDTAGSKPGDADFSAERRNGAIATTAAVGGEEALRAAGLQVADGENPSARTADGTTLKFERSENQNLRLKSIEGPSDKGADGETETGKVDGSTDKVKSIDNKDQYGNYKESQFNATEFGTISQRKYDNETVRTLLPGNNGASGQPAEIVQQKGKPAQITDGQGQKTEAATSQPIKVATSFDEPGKATQINSDGTTETSSMEDYVKNTDAAELSKQIDNFEKLAQSGPDASRQGSIDGLVKVATSDGGDSAEKAKASLGRLASDDTVKAMIVQSESKAIDHNKPPEGPAIDAPQSGAKTPYENVQLPAFQKGWGPYQALEQLRSEGKINMSNVEMKREAERIRDREFAKSGSQYFNVGDQPMMYSKEEQKSPDRKVAPKEPSLEDTKDKQEITKDKPKDTKEVTKDKPQGDQDTQEVVKDKPEVKDTQDATKDKPAQDGADRYPPDELTYNGVQPTGYEPFRNTRMEGGAYDGWDRQVMTTDDFFAGRSEFVSVAVDENAHVKDGQLFYSPEMDQKYASKMAEKYGEQWQENGHHMWLRTMDSGGAFKGTWSEEHADSPTKVDIATGRDPMSGSKETQADTITGSKSEEDQITLHMVPESNQSRLDAIKTAPVRPGKHQESREKRAYGDHGFRDEWKRGIKPEQSDSQGEKKETSPDSTEEKPDSTKDTPDSSKDKPAPESTKVPPGKIAHGINGEYMPERLAADAAERHLQNAIEVADGRRPKGDCGRGERESLNLSGFNLKGGAGQGRVATELGKYLESTGLFDKIPLKDAKEFKDGDILVRPWTDKRTAQHGGENKGDIGTLDSKGRLYNDGVSQVNLKSSLYDNKSSYILRFKEAGTESAPQEDKSVFRDPPAGSSKHLGERQKSIRDQFNILEQNDSVKTEEKKVDDSVKTEEQKPDTVGQFRNASELKNFWVVQPSGFECGPSALAMAISDKQQSKPFTAEEIHDLSRETGTMKYGAFPHGENDSNMADSAKRHGLSAETFNFEKDDPEMMKGLDSELAKGRSAIALIKNPDTGNGHFIYVAGKTDDNHYLVGNSGRSAYKDLKPVSRETLEGWMHGTNDLKKSERRRDPYFTSVW